MVTLSHNLENCDNCGKTTANATATTSVEYSDPDKFGFFDIDVYATVTCSHCGTTHKLPIHYSTGMVNFPESTF